MKNFKVTFLLRNGRAFETLITEEENFKSEDEVHNYIKDTIDDREEGIWKPFGNVTLLFSQIDGWMVDEYQTASTASIHDQ